MHIDLDELPHPAGKGVKEENAKCVSFSNNWWGEGWRKGLCLGHSTGQWGMEKTRANISWWVDPERSSRILSLALTTSLPTRRHYYLQKRKQVWKVVAGLERRPSLPDAKVRGDRTKRSFASSLVVSARTRPHGKREPRSGFWGLMGSFSRTRWALRRAGIDWGGIRVRGTHEQDSKQQALTFLSWKNHYLTQFRSHAASV